MANEHLILCGGAKRSSRKKEWRDAKCVGLRTGRSSGNVHLRISDISKALTTNLPNLDVDLLEIATYVYCADQATTRGGDKEFDYGKKWYRNFRFEIAVREPDFWSSIDVNDDLCRALGDLSGDNFEFAFHKLADAAPLADYFEFSADEPDGIEEVILFSGGLDSLGGTVDEALVRGRKVALVSHRSVTKIGTRQRQLVTDIQQRMADAKKAPLHVPVLINKDKELGREHTQRTRSFLYASLAAVVARLFGLRKIRFYENGVTSLNLPIAPQVVSTRATRTTHPMALAGMTRLFSRIYRDGFEIENPFFWKTKTEILQGIKAAGYARLCAFTGSCAHTWEQTKMHSHCGRCSQCVERRLVALAAGLGAEDDPPEMYAHQVLTDPVEGVDRALVESYLETISRLQKIDTAEKFCFEYPEITRALNHIDGSADDITRAIWDLYRRHAKQVGDAIDAEGSRLFSDIRLDRIDVNSLIRIAVSGRTDLAAEQPPAPADGEITVAAGLQVDPDRFTVRWKGKNPVEIGNRKEFRLLQALHRSEGKYIGFADLAEQLGGDSLDDVKPVMSRLRKILKEAGYEDLAECIKTQKGHYGLILPRNPKVNGAQS